MENAVIASRPILTGWFDVLELRLRLGGQEISRQVIEHPWGGVVLAYDPARRVAMTVRETRAPMLMCGVAPLPEAMGGVIEDHSDPAGTAIREAREEGGLALRAVEHIGHVWMTPASSTERCHLFLAEYGPADRVEEGGGLAHEDEHLELREEPLATLWRDMASGALSDAKLFMLLHALRVRRPELFAD